MIFEGEQEAGGVLMYGIPEYRLPKDVVRKEVKKIEALGVTFITQCMVGQAITVDDMFEQGFDAVFIGSGTALPKSLDTPGYTLVFLLSPHGEFVQHRKYRKRRSSGKTRRHSRRHRRGKRSYGCRPNSSAHGCRKSICIVQKNNGPNECTTNRI